MNEKQTKLEDIKVKCVSKLEAMLNRPASPAEVANAETDIGLLVQVLREQVVDILIRLDKNKL